MSGLIAIISHDRAHPVAEQEVDRLALTYRALRGGRIGETASAGTYAVLRTMHSEQLATRPVSRREDSWAAVVGSAHHSGDLTRATPRDLDGQFAFVSNDEGSHTLTIAADPYGLQALYVATRGNATYASTSALTLARHLDAPTSTFELNLFLLTGLQSGRATYWEGIERLTPGEFMTFGADGVERGTYWRPAVRADVAAMSLPEAVDRTVEVATATFESHLGGGDGLWADLTGGFDSRLLCMLVDHAGVRFTCNTFGRPDSPDVALGERVARAAGWPWTRFDRPHEWPDMLAGRLSHAVGWGDGVAGALNLARVLHVHEQQAPAGQRLLHGGGADHLKGYPWRHEPLAAGRSVHVKLDRWISLRVITAVPAGLLASDPRAAAREELRARLASWLEPYAGQPNTVQMHMLQDLKATGRYGAFRSAALASLESELPMHFKDVHETVFSVSHHHRSNGKLARHVMQRVSPELARLATTQGGPAEPFRWSAAHRFAPFYAIRAQNLVNKVGRQAVGRAPLARSAAPDLEAARARCNALDAMGEGATLSAGGMHTAHLYAPAALDALLSAARSPGFSDGEMLDRVLTVELTVRAAAGDPLVFGGGASAPPQRVPAGESA